MVVIYGLVILLVIALIFGFIGSDEIGFQIEINRLNSPFFKIGVTSERHILTDGNIEDEVVIALFFIHFVFIFFKVVEEQEEI